MRRLVLVAVVVGLAGNMAEAAVVALGVRISTSSRNLYLRGWVSKGDNGGLASWGAAMTNLSDIVLMTPEVALSAEHGNTAAGFTVFKSTAPSGFGSSQDVTKPALYQEFGVGQAPGVVGGFPGVFEDVPYGYPVLLARGRVIGDGPLDLNHIHNLPLFVSCFANVYRVEGQSGGLGDVKAAQVTTWDYDESTFFTSKPGDVDENGKVDISDVAVLQTKYGTTAGATWFDGDFDGNGTVDIFDVAAMQVNYGYGVGGGATAVPEPSTLALGALGALAILLAWRRKCASR